MRPEQYFLRDILFAAEAISATVRGIDWVTFQATHLFQAAIKYDLLVIGEAAGKVSGELREKYLDLDWRPLKDFRNILAHEYFALDLELIWEAAVDRTPALASRIREILSTEFPTFPLDLAED